MKNYSNSMELVRALKNTLFRQRLVIFVAGLFATGASAVLSWLGLSLLAGIIVLPVWLKISLLAVASLVTIYAFARFAVSRLFTGSTQTLAVDLETRHSELKGRLVAALQFAEKQKTPGYSAELMDLTVAQALERCGRINFSETVRFYPLWRSGRLALGGGLLALIMVALVPGLFSHSFEVYSHPTIEIAPPLGYSLVPLPGSTEWVKYRDIEIGAALVGAGLPDHASVFHRLAGGSWQRTEIDTRRLKHYQSGDGDSLLVTTTLRQINRSFDYYVEAGRVKTEVMKVDVVDRPRVTGIKLSVFYPEYTSLPPTTIDENNGSVSAITGSRVSMHVETNLPIRQASLIFSDSSQTPLEVSDRSAETSLLIARSASYHIRLVDRLGEINPDAIEYYITAIPDEYPSIDVIRPGFDVNLDDEMLLPLKVRIFDDYGFSSLVLKYSTVSRNRPSDEHVAVLHFSDKIKTEGEVEFNWDMDQLNLFPGDYVIYSLEVADNDQISGPKVTSSRRYIARLPSLEEIVAQTEAENVQRIGDTRNLLKRGQELTSRLKSAVRKLKANEKNSRKADWQQTKDIESIVKENENMLDDVEKIAEKMDESLEQLAKNALVNREILEKMQQIQKLFEDVATPEMREAQKKLAEALSKMDRKEIEDAMKQLQMSQEEVLQRLERTLALLKKMQAEQKMQAMTRKAENILKRQEQMNKETKSADKSDLPGKSEEEQKIKASLDELKKEVGELKEMLKEAGMEQSEEANKFADAVQKTDADQDMQQMSQSMQQQNKQQASKQGKQAKSKLTQMLDQMQQQMMAMSGDDNEKTKRLMQAAINDANYLSKDQEDQLREAAALNARSMMLRDQARDQQDLASACSGLKSRIGELGKQSPFVAAELQRLVEDATRQMQVAVDAFDAKKGAQAQRAQREAMTQLNQASMRMMESLDQQKQCNKGGNCNKNQSKLQSICNSQNKLNQNTQKQCNNPSSGNPRDGAAGRKQLQKLAAEQGSIRKSLEDLNREFGGSRQILGRLDDIARQMKEVEEELQSGQIGEETAERQLRIFSRLLEASRSLQRRDFTDQRQATTAASEAFLVPNGLTDDVLNDEAKLEDRLRQFLSEEYPRQYESQIKAYFKALLNSETQAAGSTAR
ncbi:MAG: DUF4175 family protein [Candidatus Zixiibacteriota bacterium]